MCLDFGLKLSFKVMVRNIKLITLERSEIFVYFKDTLNTFYLLLYGTEYF